MDMHDADPAPAALGELRNFSWLQEGVIARGEQPLQDGTFTALADVGINTVLSLREDGDPARVVSGRPYPDYSTADEERACARAELSFRHVSCEDFQAPRAAEIAAALRVIDESVARGAPIFVHCAAGVGRTGVVTCAWLLTRGWSSDAVMAIYFRFCEEIYQRRPDRPEGREAFFRRIGTDKQWWALLCICDALNCPRPTATPPIEPHQPPGTDGWEEEYRQHLYPWRRVSA